MSWTENTYVQYERGSARYASDLTEGEWALIEPFMPMPNRIGRPRRTDLREVVNALLYIASTGCQWRFLPKDFPPFSTAQKYFYRFAWLGRSRRLAKDWEKTIESAIAWLFIAHIRIVTRWLARP